MRTHECPDSNSARLARFNVIEMKADRLRPGETDLAPRSQVADNTRNAETLSRKKPRPAVDQLVERTEPDDGGSKSPRNAVLLDCLGLVRTAWD